MRFLTVLTVSIFFAKGLAWLPEACAEFSLAQSAFHRGMLLKDEGRLEEAERFMKKALELEPSNHQYHFELANVYALRYDQKPKDRHRDKMLRSAARELEQAVMLHPDFIQAYFNLGVVYKKQGEYEKAREQFRTVLQIEPSLVNAHLQIGATYEQQGFFHEARDAYEQALRLDYGNAGIDGALDDLQERKKEDEERMLAETAATRLNRYQSAFPYTPDGQAAGYEQKRQEQLDSSAGMEQAIPYLGSWLISQFMNWRESRD